MSLPIIGIAGNQLVHASQTFNGNQVTYTPQGFVDAVQIAGGLPLVLPIGEPTLAQSYIKQIDKLLLAGGQDIMPQLFGEEPSEKLGEINPARDHFEIALVKEAVAQRKPIFAVCRGVQLVNVALGGTLYQDLSFYEKPALKHEQAPTAPWFATHEVKTAPDSLVNNLIGDSHLVNSYHHQGIKEIAPQLKATAWANDGIVEALESTQPEHKILGVQWHPELNHYVDAKEQGLFNYFVNQL
ncbi:gamma-glutamyl-gamma-aminobutyrate hydrolase family protein [Enterococcus sp. LJL120]